MHPTFNSLQANLSEIYAAIPAFQRKGSLPLLATSPSTVYYEDSWAGQIVKKWQEGWRWIKPTYSFPSVENALTSILNTLFNHSVCLAYTNRQQRIWNCMHQVDLLFQPANKKEQEDRYAQFLACEIQGSKALPHLIHLIDFNKINKNLLNENEEREQRHTIVNFQQATYPFWSLMIKNKLETENIRGYLMKWIDPSSALVDRVLFKLIKKEARWAHLEGVIGQSIPISLLAKMNDPSRLTVDEKRRLTSWVQALNHHQKELSSRLLFVILTEVMLIIHLQGSSSTTLQHVLLWLDHQGCPLLHQEDPVHIEWRSKLQPGKTIKCNGKELTLGKQLSPPKLLDDHYKIFELENHPEWVVKIAHNRLRLLIEEQQAKNEQEHWGVRLVETIANLEEDDKKPSISGMDQQGRCVVLEKLFFPLDSHIWKSSNVKLTDQDEKIALVFANHLFCMSQWKASAQNISCAHLMWDKAEVLKSTRILKKGPANYNEWEAYCETAAKGNTYVLTFMMKVSKLSQHPIALYYQGAVENVLRTGETDLISRALPLDHRQKIYTKHIEVLCQEAQALRSKCFKHVQANLRLAGQYSYQEDSQLETKISDILLKMYRLSPTLGRFSSTLEQEVIKIDFQDHLSDKIGSPSLNAEKYYQTKHDLMMKLNQATLKPHLSVKIPKEG